MAGWEEHLLRWERAGAVDSATAQRIRALELQRETPAEHRWQVGVMLALGIILLVGGLMLFVAAHWDQVSPWQRLSLVMGFLVTFHALAAASSNRFPGMAMALHGVGTAGAGAAILTVGEIFNMQEHWPTAVLLWALCAGTGWWLLRDQVQQTITMLLVPSWLVCEWCFRAEGYSCTAVYSSRMSAVIAAVMLTGFFRSKRRGVFWTLFISGALGLVVSTGILSNGWTEWERKPMVPVGLRLASVAVIIAVGLGGWLWERRNLIPVLAAVLMGYLLPWRPTYRVKDALEYAYGGAPTFHDEPGAVMYILVAVTTMVIAWWGLRERFRAVVNYSVVAFGMTVLWFYFSTLMNRVGRSLGLIGLGLLFLLGGVLLERLRRRLIAEMAVRS